MNNQNIQQGQQISMEYLIQKIGRMTVEKEMIVETFSSQLAQAQDQITEKDKRIGELETKLKDLENSKDKKKNEKKEEITEKTGENK